MGVFNDLIFLVNFKRERMSGVNPDDQFVGAIDQVEVKHFALEPCFSSKCSFFVIHDMYNTWCITCTRNLFLILFQLIAPKSLEFTPQCHFPCTLPGCEFWLNLKRLLIPKIKGLPDFYHSVVFFS